MTEKDIAIERALRELERIQQEPSTASFYQAMSQNDNDRVALSDEFTSEIATEIAEKLNDSRIKQTLKASAVAFFKSGKSVDFVWSIEGISEHISRDELIELKEALQ